MRRFITQLVPTILSFAIASTSIAAEPVSWPTPASPLAPIALLVGGVWRGQLPPAKNGAKIAIELRCSWTANHQGIRFDSAFLVDSKRSPYTSGVYNWNAAKKQIVFVYSDAEGSLTEGAFHLENGRSCMTSPSPTLALRSSERARSLHPAD